MIRWGILGTARINRRVVPAMHASRRGQLCAVASRDLARATAHATQYAIPTAVQGYQALLVVTGPLIVDAGRAFLQALRG